MRLSVRAKPCFVAAICALATPAGAEAVLTTAYQDLPPKYVARPDGTVDGLCHELMREIDRRAPDLRFESAGFRPWKRIQRDLASGAIDVVFCMARSAARERQYVYVDPPLYAVKHVALARASDTRTPRSIGDLVAMSPLILTNEGSATARWLRARGVRVDDSANGLNLNIDKLLQGRGRYLYFHDLGLTWALRQRGDITGLQIVNGPFRTYAHYIAFSQTAPAAQVAAVTAVLGEMKRSGALDDIRRRWVAWPAALAEPDSGL